MVLLDCPADSVWQVEALNLPLELGRRLEALGMIPGSRVDVLRKKRRGAMIITVRGTRFAMGRDIAAHITVKEEGGPRHAP
ncbi:MAG: ferrous iron transport protein A [Acutalibacter sp.]|nr:ferrous iron transport protein A [Acutalibacter sp.]